MASLNTNVDVIDILNRLKDLTVEVSMMAKVNGVLALSSDDPIGNMDIIRKVVMDLSKE